MFQQREAWWDLLCVIEEFGAKGVVIYAPSLTATNISSTSTGSAGVTAGATPAPPPPPHPTPAAAEPSDTKMSMASLSATATRALPLFGRGGGGAERMTAHEAMDQKFISVTLSGIEARLGEDWIRGQFYDYCHMILMQAMDKLNDLQIDTTKMNDNIKKIYESNIYRADILSRSEEVLAMPVHPWVWCKEHRSGMKADDLVEGIEKGKGTSGLTLRRHIRRLLLETSISNDEVQTIFEDLDKSIRTECSYQALLSLLLEKDGGIYSLAVGLYHRDDSVKIHTIRILSRMETFASTSPLLRHMNGFLKYTYNRYLLRVYGSNKLNENVFVQLNDDNIIDEKKNDQLQTNNEELIKNNDCNNISNENVNVAAHEFASMQTDSIEHKDTSNLNSLGQKLQGSEEKAQGSEKKVQGSQEKVHGSEEMAHGFKVVTSDREKASQSLPTQCINGVESKENASNNILRASAAKVELSEDVLSPDAMDILLNSNVDSGGGETQPGESMTDAELEELLAMIDTES